MREKMLRLTNLARQDPAVDTLVGFAGGGSTNTGRIFITLKPLAERKIPVDQVMNRLRGKLAVVPGATLFMQPAQDLQTGGRQSSAQFQYTLQSENLNDLNTWAPRLLQKLRSLRELVDVNTDQQDRGLEARVLIEPDTAARPGGKPPSLYRTRSAALRHRPASSMY